MTKEKRELHYLKASGAKYQSIVCSCSGRQTQTRQESLDKTKKRAITKSTKV